MILGFNEVFIPAILAGVKVHTIREGQRWQVGASAHFCARAHQPDQYEFRAPLPILSIQDIELQPNALRVDGRLLTESELQALAKADGFATAHDLLLFFAHKPLPFRGQLLHWTRLRY